MTSMRPLTFIFLCFLFAGSAAAQSSNKNQKLAEMANDAYQIPFASKGNQLELAVANIGTEAMEQVQVTATLVPQWLTLDKRSITLTGIDPGKEDYALFGFSIDREAEVEESSMLSFEIRFGSDVIGEKEFMLAVQAPQEVKLDQNYPNPFSGQTKIGFDVTHKGRVQIEVYDMLGRQVSRLLDEELNPGHHLSEWNGDFLASGIYFYVLKATSSDGRIELRRNKMILVK